MKCRLHRLVGFVIREFQPGYNVIKQPLAFSDHAIYCKVLCAAKSLTIKAATSIRLLHHSSKQAVETHYSSSERQ